MTTCAVCGTTIHKGEGIIAGRLVWLDSDELECSSSPAFHDHEPVVLDDVGYVAGDSGAPGQHRRALVGLCDLPTAHTGPHSTTPSGEPDELPTDDELDARLFVPTDEGRAFLAGVEAGRRAVLAELDRLQSDELDRMARAHAIDLGITSPADGCAGHPGLGDEGVR